MYLYKCECGLLTSELFKTCPSCGVRTEKERVNTNDLDEVVFRLTMDDVVTVMDNSITPELADKLKDVSHETIQDLLSRKMEIPWTEYIEGALEALFGGDR